MDKIFEYANFASILISEGLSPIGTRIDEILSLSPSAIHRISYSGMVAEVSSSIHCLDELRGAEAETISGQALQECVASIGAPKDISSAYQFAEHFICKVMPNAVRSSDLSRIRTQLYFDTTYEPETKTSHGLQIVRLLDLTDPGHNYTPGSPNARVIEKLDPASIFAWYSRNSTSPFHIDDGSARMNRISKGYVYQAPDAVIPEASKEELQKATQEILEEASTLRVGSIPNAAFVEIDIPPLVCLCFTEISPDLVLMEGLDANSRALPIIFQPSLGWVHGPNTGSGPDGNMDSFEHYVALIALLGAAAIRDFWVIEDREKSLGPARVSRPRGLKSNKSRVIYLPRIRYVEGRLGQSSLEARTKTASERRAHWRSAHFRKLPTGSKPSKKQLLLAAAQNIKPPAGTTWVRSSNISGNDGDLIYRSRSATAALFDVIPFEKQSHAGLSWFAFERLCARELNRQGFEELTRKGGDKGTDIFCSRGTGPTTETWVVQCKHWNAKIGPDVVRDLHGARALRTADRALLITSSAFTQGAIETAADLGIELLDLQALERSISI